MKLLKFLALAALSIAVVPTTAKAQDGSAPVAPDLTSQPAGISLIQSRDDKTILEAVVGYVNKSWRCTYPNVSQREDFFGDPDAKYFHGIQLGALYTPSFDWGLGLRTGLLLESYISYSRWIRDWCDHFSELDLYIPLHASFHVPVSTKCGLDVYGGMGFQWAISGEYRKRIGTGWSGRRPVPLYQSKRQEYGDGWPQRVNWQAECGLKLYYDRFALNFTYSFGLTEHGIENTFDGGQTFITATKSRQDKMQASFIVMFGLYELSE